MNPLDDPKIELSLARRMARRLLKFQYPEADPFAAPDQTLSEPITTIQRSVEIEILTP